MSEAATQKPLIPTATSSDPLLGRVESIISSCKKIDFKSETFDTEAALFHEALVLTKNVSLADEFHPITTPIMYERAMDEALVAKYGYKMDQLNMLNDKMQSVHKKAVQMRDLCEVLTRTIAENKEKTEHFLAQTNAIRSKMSLLEAKANAVGEFLEKFMLSEKEENALQGDPNDGTVSMEFFPALQRCQEIYDESKRLVRTSVDHVAAVEVMEQMSGKMEKAYEILYRSVQRECRLLSSDFNDVKNVVVHSFRALQDREVLFKYALDEFAMARKNHVLRVYIDALTRGAGGSNGSKPMEMLSHDPLRYIGDMLAWMYQAIENEKEISAMLLKQCRPEVISACSLDVVAQISSALCRPFKIRVEQSLANVETSPVTVYKINGLFGYYISKVSSITGSSSELCQTIRELQSLAMDIFVSSLTSVVQKMLSRMGPPDYDLLPVPAVHHLLSLLKDILDSHNGGMTVENPKEQFNQVFTCVLDPLLRSVQLAATQLSSELDVAVYTLNCLSLIQSAVMLYQFTDQRIEMLKALIEGNEDVLVSEESSSILSRMYLLTIYQKAAAHTPQQGPMSAIPGLDVATISSAFSSFETFLTQKDVLRMDTVARVSSARIRESITTRTIQNIIAAYSVLVRKLEDPANNYGDVKFKTSEEVAELLK